MLLHDARYEVLENQIPHWIFTIHSPYLVWQQRLELRRVSESRAKTDKNIPLHNFLLPLKVKYCMQRQNERKQKVSWLVVRSSLFKPREKSTLLFDIRYMYRKCRKEVASFVEFFPVFN